MIILERFEFILFSSTYYSSKYFSLGFTKEMLWLTLDGTNLKLKTI